ncbi:TlpA family protein disulfide reductase [Flavivirga eckloniae]|uniref:Thioredoxin domain-containing protein n=1 Tax=Flavivirga eckloniae TaxID=1803846 RepID=A0A2K9PPF7_9FLAO|nr:TlpA disulfide reductase family protein [Flavivirga eckloniae]AUP78926.1 hypothetical protein C1H87_09520 [Flavivirga eckloniae]
MKKVLLYVLISIIVFTSCKAEKKELTPLTLGDFEISTDKITHNEPFTITYHGDDPEMESFYHQLKDYNAYAYDINFTNKKAVLTIPDSISAIAFTFKVNGEFDSNEGKGYLLKVHDINGNTVSGNNSTIANYPLTHGYSYGLIGSGSQLIEALEKDFEAFPEFKKKNELSYLYILRTYDQAKMKIAAEEKIKELEAKEDLDENDYSILLQTYELIGKPKLADSIKKMVIRKFPDGKIKIENLTSEFYNTQDVVKKEQLFKQIQAKTNGGFNFGISALAIAYYEAGNMDAFHTYVDLIESPFEKASFFNTIVNQALSAGKNVDGFISNIAKQSVELTKGGMLSSGYQKQLSLTENENEEKFNQKHDAFLETYINISLKQGNLKEAIKHQELLIRDGYNLYLNDKYIEYLMADNQFKLVTDKAPEFLTKGTGTDQMLVAFKKAYKHVNPNGNLKEAVANIENKYAEKELEYLKKTMLNEDAPDFTLKNLDGKEVTMASLKGKTVILDFWATWCGPCKASFPGMQKLIEKYKDNENIVFVFINTLDSGFKTYEDRVKTVTNYMVKKKFNFNNLFDTMDEDTKSFDLASKYNINSIPTKIVIAPNGKVKFKSLGGGAGQDNALITKMDLMIRLANP